MFLYTLSSKMLNITENLENRFYMEYLDCQSIVGICVCFGILIYLIYALKRWGNRVNKGLLGNDIFIAFTVLAMFALSLIVKRFGDQYSISLLFGVTFAACFACLFSRSLEILWPGPHTKNDVFALYFPSLVYLMPQLIIALEYCLLIHRIQDLNTPDETQRNTDFVCLVSYVCALLLTTTIISLKLTEFPSSRRQGVYGFVLFATCLMSLSIWAAWMYMFITKKFGCISWVSVCTIVSTYNGWAMVFAYFCPTIYIIAFKTDDLEEYRELDDRSSEDSVSYVSVETPSTSSEEEDDEPLLKDDLDLPTDSEPPSPLECKPPPPTPNEYLEVPHVCITEPPVVFVA
ncbi:membrane protein EE34 [Proboscivirus elephantidbeta5]|uniref:Membrane protein EE34 n=1 Tax=Elephant endotheliotropic herpesvirus 5 TaxID=768738 RepID=A0A075CYL5_9BETA|nr:membrane protein EE34 [Elephant endotheliotropic herpesvirus 5]AHC02797.1 membrane protein EE34 [Elephant endotheliotropic herpesvirus 5]